jgi:CYTH domain-containing protein
MAVEIERKFLVSGTGWRQSRPRHLSQGYLNRDKHRTVRVRIDDACAFLTIKGITIGATRGEFEYPIPVADAKQLLALCDGAVIEKLRHEVLFEGMRWEVDEFLGRNAGLVVAEIELATEAQAFARPAWLGEEVTHDPRYFNSSLATHPFESWPTRQDCNRNP